MALKDTMNSMNKMLVCLCNDMGKAAKGNKAACQRIRTNTIKFAKIAKYFRKESVAAGKGGKTARKKTKTSTSKTTKKTAKKSRKKTAKRKKRR